MRLGLLADIHEEVDLLAACIAALRRRAVERFVVLGDVFDLGPRLFDTVRLLLPLDSVGVWGNHDFGLCGEVPDTIRGRFPDEVFAYFSTLQPRVEIAGCLFQHIEPHLDPEKLEDLWSYGGDGQLSPDVALRSVPHRRCFMGHIHRWQICTTAGKLNWDGIEPLTLPPERSLVVVHAVQQGYCAVYDTTSELLEPIRVSA